METNFFFSRDSEAALGGTFRRGVWPKVRPWEARFGPELDWDKPWRDIQTRRLAPKVRPWEACFGPELDWEKLWRDQVFGAKMTETNGHKLLFF